MNTKQQSRLRKEKRITSIFQSGLLCRNIDNAPVQLTMHFFVYNALVFSLSQRCSSELNKGAILS